MLPSSRSWNNDMIMSLSITIIIAVAISGLSCKLHPRTILCVEVV